MELFCAGTNISSYVLNILFAGCDFICPYCYSKPYLSAKGEFLTDVRDIKRYINESDIKKVNFTGGEPTLQRAALLDLAAFAKKNKIKTRLETNGAHTYVIGILLRQELIDEIVVDIKCPFRDEIFEKATRSSTFFRDSVSIIGEIHNTLSLLKEYEKRVSVIFNTTIVPGLMFRKEDILEVAESLQDVRGVWQLTPFSPDFEELNSRKFRSIMAPSRDFLESLRQACLKQYPHLSIDVMD